MFKSAERNGMVLQSRTALKHIISVKYTPLGILNCNKLTVMSVKHLDNINRDTTSSLRCDKRWSLYTCNIKYIFCIGVQPTQAFNTNIISVL